MTVERAFDEILWYATHGLVGLAAGAALISVGFWAAMLDFPVTSSRFSWAAFVQYVSLPFLDAAHDAYFGRESECPTS